MPTEHKSGNVTVSVNDALERVADRSKQLASPISRQLDRQIEEIEADAAFRWPVDTGRSRDGLFSGVLTQQPDFVEAFISNDVPYAQFVRFENSLAFDKLVIQPVLRRLPEIAALIGETVTETLEG